jgi:hypothetical protein
VTTDFFSDSFFLMMMMIFFVAVEILLAFLKMLVFATLSNFFY